MVNKNFSNLLGKWKNKIPKEGDSTPIQMRIYKLYQTRLDDFDSDDIRFMIGQNIGEKFLIPIALKYLKEDLLYEAIYYEGDLLHSIIKLPEVFWCENIKLYEKIYDILLEQNEKLGTLNSTIKIDKEILSAVERFLKHPN